MKVGYTGVFITWTCFPDDMTQTRLYSNRRRLEARNFRFKNKRGCTFVKQKQRCCSAVMICISVFANAKGFFSHDVSNRVHIFHVKCIIEIWS